MSVARKPEDRRALSPLLPLAKRQAGRHGMGVRISVEEVDLAELSEALRQRFALATPTGYLRGRTALRDAVAGMLSCSELRAEELVDTLIVRGFVRYEGDPTANVDGDQLPWLLLGG